MYHQSTPSESKRPRRSHSRADQTADPYPLDSLKWTGSDADAAESDDPNTIYNPRWVHNSNTTTSDGYELWDADLGRSRTRLSEGNYNRKDYIPKGSHARSSRVAPADQDSKKDSEAYSDVKEFATGVSSAHGFPNIFKAKNVVGRIFWTGVFLAALGVFVWQATILCKRFFSYPVTVEIKIITRSELEFPAVTICNNNKVRRSQIARSKYKEALVIDDSQTQPYWGPCIEGDFSCTSGMLCLKQFLRCDGIDHCRDFSDEEGCIYRSCPDDMFQCLRGSAMGPCIPSNLKCNRESDCYDGDDETGCECKPTEFSCTKGGCVPKTFWCNSFVDCKDGSDEIGCDSDSECSGEFKCPIEDKCIPLMFVCDTFNDCVDGSDEESYACALVTEAPDTSSCSPSEFECGDGACIYDFWQCDGYPDCLDLSDENGSVCEAGEQRCDTNQVMCPNGWQCILPEYLCDLEQDCIENDDEYNCTCKISGPPPTSPQNLKCLGAVSYRYGYPESINTTSFADMNCSNEEIAESSPHPVNRFNLFTCSGVLLCSNGINDFPEPCQVLHDCYTAPNGQDYRGNVYTTESGMPCSDWAVGVAVDAGFSSDVYPELVSRVCRNPAGTREKPWCFFEGAVSIDEWEYCDVGPPSDTCHPGVDLPVRLANGPSSMEGRVEVSHGGSWGAISDGNWTAEDATVVCRQLGFAGVARTTADFTAGSESVFITEVICLGHELYLVDCQYVVVIATEDAGYNSVVGVTCSGSRRRRQAEDVQTLETPTGECDPAKYFNCSSGECIPKWQTCNNYPDCKDGSDEYADDLKCNGENIVCPSSEKPCRNHSSCIPKWFECDGLPDCFGGTDEQFCNDVTEQCPDDYRACMTGRCIHYFKFCDTIQDCPFSEDEYHCTNRSEDHLSGTINPFKDDTWKDPFRYLVPAEDADTLFDNFKNEFYVERPFSRVLSENPADWQRFVTYSEKPDFSDLVDVMKLTKDELGVYGHQLQDMVLQCTFGRERCSQSHFVPFQDDNYGNCFTFNFNESGPSQHNSSWTGEQSGLALTLFTEQSEYISLYGQQVGFRLSLTTPDTSPLPADEGINIAPGTLTSIGLRYNLITRKPYPFGDCQISKTTTLKIKDGTIISEATDNYNRMQCQRICYHQNVINICNCTDTSELNGERCKILDPDQDLCKQMVFYLYSYNHLDCSCPTQCTDRLYTTTMSTSVWPSDAYMPHLLRSVHYINPRTKIIQSAQDVSKNMLRLRIFFEELNFQQTLETEAYPGTSLFGDIGGTISLYIGFSIITILEFIEFLIKSIKKRCTRNTRTASHKT